MRQSARSARKLPAISDQVSDDILDQLDKEGTDKYLTEAFKRLRVDNPGLVLGLKRFLRDQSLNTAETKAALYGMVLTHELIQKQAEASAKKMPLATGVRLGSMHVIAIIAVGAVLVGSIGAATSGDDQKVIVTQSSHAARTKCLNPTPGDSDIEVPCAYVAKPEPAKPAPVAAQPVKSTFTNAAKTVKPASTPVTSSNTPAPTQTTPPASETTPNEPPAEPPIVVVIPPPIEPPPDGL